MQILAGTSGFAYEAWKGPFYPDDLADADRLSYYAGRLPAVEINNTFYRLPTDRLISGWAEQVPEDFRIVLKASRKITHHARLRGVEDTLAYLVNTAAGLGERLGAHLFQLPPYAKADPDVLESFLALLPEGHRAAMEFRHPSWFQDAVYDVLREHDAALVIVDGGKVEVPEVATAGWGYLRLRRDAYGDAALREWAARIAEQDWSRAYVFFKHEDEAEGPRMARRLIELAG